MHGTGFFFGTLLQSQDACVRNHLEISIGRSDRQLSSLHVEDLCQAVFLCLESPVRRVQFLVSDQNTYTEKEFNEIVRRVLGKRTLSISLPGWLMASIARVAELKGRISGKAPLLIRDRLPELSAANWAVDCSEIVKIGFKPCLELEEGIVRMEDGIIQMEEGIVRFIKSRVIPNVRLMMLVLSAPSMVVNRSHAPADRKRNDG